MWDHIDEKLADHEGLRKGAAIAKYSELIHLGRVSVPEDVAGFVSYLAFPDSGLHDRPVGHDRRRDPVLLRRSARPRSRAVLQTRREATRGDRP